MLVVWGQVDAFVVADAGNKQITIFTLEGTPSAQFVRALFAGAECVVRLCVRALFFHSLPLYP